MTILNQFIEQVQVGTEYHFGALCWVITLIGLAIIIISWIFAYKIDIFGFGLVMMIMMLFLMAVGTACAGDKPIYKDITTYEVIINEDTSFHEIFDNYDVIEQRGNIFTIREKGWENPE